MIVARKMNTLQINDNVIIDKKTKKKTTKNPTRHQNESFKTANQLFWGGVSTKHSITMRKDHLFNENQKSDKNKIGDLTNHYINELFVLAVWDQ